MVKIKDYINNNYNISGNLTFEHVNGVCVVNCDGDVEVKNQKIEKLTDGFVWGTIKGNFDCSWCDMLELLEGAPKEVGENFDCSYCENLISIKGSPEKVGEDFICTRCNNIESLEGAPKKVNNFYCSDCSNLTSLKGSPKEVSGVFNCADCSELKSLEGAPKEVKGDFICHNCPNLKSLEGASKEVGSFYCSLCSKLILLKEILKYINNDFLR